MSDPGVAEGQTGPAPETGRAPALAALPTAAADPEPTIAEAVSPADTAIDERSLLALYLGPNAEVYLHTYDRIAGSRYGIVTWSWPALLVPLAWLLYRKLWVPAAWFIFLPSALIYVFEVNSIVFYIQVAIATQAKQLCVWQGQKRIARILAVETDPATIRRKATLAGGTSVTGLAIGSLVTLVATLYGVIAAFNTGTQ